MIRDKEWYNQTNLTALMTLFAFLSLLISFHNASSIQDTRTKISNLNDSVYELRSSPSSKAWHQIQVIKDEKERIVEQLNQVEKLNSSVNETRLKNCNRVVNRIDRNLSSLRGDYTDGNYSKILEYEFPSADCKFLYYAKFSAPKQYYRLPLPLLMISIILITLTLGVLMKEKNE
jgi:hypothetical protein